jgi:hypothetical protein
VDLVQDSKNTKANLLFNGGSNRNFLFKHALPSEFRTKEPSLAYISCLGGNRHLLDKFVTVNIHFDKAGRGLEGKTIEDVRMFVIDEPGAYEGDKVVII